MKEVDKTTDTWKTSCRAVHAIRAINRLPIALLSIHAFTYMFTYAFGSLETNNEQTSQSKSPELQARIANICGTLNRLDQIVYFIEFACRADEQKWMLSGHLAWTIFFTGLRDQIVYIPCIMSLSQQSNSLKWL